MSATLLPFVVAIGLPALIAVIALVYAVLAYNRLVDYRNRVREGWSGIDVQLKRRANLVVNLVETVKGYAAHEKGTLEAVARARDRSLGTDGPPDRHVQAENRLTAALGQLFALAEAYPDLRTDASFRELQAQLVAIEADLEKARRYYNGTVSRFNTLVEQFPSTLVAHRFGFALADYFEIDDPAKRALPEIGFGD